MKTFVLRAVLLASALNTPTQASERVDLLIRHATVVDVPDGCLVENQDIAVRDGRIVAIETAGKPPAWKARESLDASGRFAIPGLWDMHVHLGGGDALIADNRNLLPFYVGHGVTTARGTAVTPTLNGSRVIAYLDQDDNEHDAYLEYIGPGLQGTYAWRVERAAKDDAAAIRRRHKRYERTAALLPLLQQPGSVFLSAPMPAS